MLIQFNFKNYKSFKDETTLSMETSPIKEHPDHCFLTHFNDELLKSVVIYGANAFGKSNLIDALRYMRNLVLNKEPYFDENSREEGFKLPRFLFDRESKEGTSSFELFFNHNNCDYQYGFEIDNKKVYEEWLFVKRDTGKDFETVFERKDSNIDLGNDLKKDFKKSVEIYENKLLLEVLKSFKIGDIKNVIEWFTKLMIVNDNGLLEQPFMLKSNLQVFLESKHKSQFIRFLNDVDIDIVDFEVVESNEIKTIYTIHNNSYQSNERLLLKEESSGTRKMISLYLYLYKCFTEGNILVIDELDAKLHPLLLRYLLIMFNDRDLNMKNGQLIYTSHDIFTLSKDIFRRDQIYFVDKNVNQESVLYSLAEYKMDENIKVRNDATYYKDYLLGKYKAIPDFKDYKKD